MWENYFCICIKEQQKDTKETEVVTYRGWGREIGAGVILSVFTFLNYFNV